jgi:serine/threonine protein kinase
MEDVPDLAAGELWSIGTILYSLLEGNLAFDGETDQDIWQQISTLECDLEQNNSRNQKAFALMKSLLDKDSLVRKDIISILNDEWLLNLQGEKTWGDINKRDQRDAENMMNIGSADLHEGEAVTEMRGLYKIMAKEKFIDAVVSILQNRSSDKVFMKAVKKHYYTHRNQPVTE